MEREATQKGEADEWGMMPEDYADTGDMFYVESREGPIRRALRALANLFQREDPQDRE